MTVSLSDGHRAMIDSACHMYGTAAQLQHAGMLQDANAVAMKAKLLMNKALEDVIEITTASDYKE